jgi:prepilin-type N-terminal cleavage/methylation domain-containing protein
MFIGEEVDEVVRSRESGFTLLELLAVVGIFLILSAIAIVSWDSYAPVMALDAAAQALSDSLQLAMEKSHTQRNEWFVLLNYGPRLYTCTDGNRFQFSRDTYVIVNDDGWKGTGSRQFNDLTGAGSTYDQYFEEYDPDHGDYRVQRRNNNLLEDRELYRGPLRLGRGITLIPSPDDGVQVRRIVFDFEEPTMYWQTQLTPDNTPINSADRKTEPARIYLKNYKFRIGDNTRDNLTHRRIIKVYPNNVKIIR